jgi:hypothetical protein
MAARLKRIKGSCGCGTRSCKFYGRTCKSKTAWSLGARPIAISGALLETLKNERQEMRTLIAALHELCSGVYRELTAGKRSAFAQTLLALAQTLDSHVERYDGGVLPSILRAALPQIAFPLSCGGRDNRRRRISFAYARSVTAEERISIANWPMSGIQMIYAITY